MPRGLLTIALLNEQEEPMENNTRNGVWLLDGMVAPDARSSNAMGHKDGCGRSCDADVRQVERQKRSSSAIRPDRNENDTQRMTTAAGCHLFSPCS